MKRKEVLEQLRDMDADELEVQAESLKESLFRLKFKKAMGVGETINDIRRERKTLAQVYTVMREREMESKKAETGQV